MRLKYVTGCTCTSLQVDGKEFNIDLTKQERLDVCKKILPITTSSKIFGDIIYYNHIMSSKDFADLNWEDTCKEYDKIDEEVQEFKKLDIETQRTKALEMFEGFSTYECEQFCISQDIFCIFLEEEGKGGYLYTCDECGDSVYEYKINI